ncbi:MAG: A/G-specific adenine glycosylase [Gemmatimonadetes bacterium]|nr:A/G-specific adenine glycosylase [Gemmatimonadota bacterium]
MSAEEHRERVRASLLDWYQAHRRELPWRKDSDPYAVWVSEMMLQQTQVATVIPYFERWLTLFPDVATLAAAEEADVLHAWQGLGYYSRARNLLKGARAVVSEHAGRVPADVEQLRALPGVGPYTAGAIASIAHNRAEPTVDGNVIRVLSRLYALEGDPTKAAPKRRLWELAAELVPASAPGDFNQALMELGATVCTPRAPRCEGCPVEGSCLARARGTVELRPPPRKRGPVPHVHVLSLVVWTAEARTLLVQRPERGLLAGLWEFPARELAGPPDPGRCASPLPPVEHVFSHLKATYHPLLIRMEDPPDSAEAALERVGAEGARPRWVTVPEAEVLALPVAQQKILAALAGVGR